MLDINISPYLQQGKTTGLLFFDTEASNLLLTEKKPSTNLILIPYHTASYLHFSEIFSDVMVVPDCNHRGQNPRFQKEADNNKPFWYGSWESRAMGVMTLGCFIYPQGEKQQQPLWLTVPWHNCDFGNSIPSRHWQHKHFVANCAKQAANYFTNDFFSLLSSSSICPREKNFPPCTLPSWKMAIIFSFCKNMVLILQ